MKLLPFEKEQEVSPPPFEKEQEVSPFEKGGLRGIFKGNFRSQIHLKTPPNPLSKGGT
jgi:hypothetical protein